MLGILLLTAAASGSAQPAPTRTDQVADSKAPIVVRGKPQLVCTEFRPTGSRIRRQKVCRTLQQVEEERLSSGRALNEGMREQMVKDAIACGPTSIKMCD